MAISNQQKKRATKKINVTPQPLKIRGGAPSGNVSKSEILQRMLENNALRLVSEEIVDKTGTPVTGVTSVTWATFTGGSFDLTTARYVHVSDKHSTRNATATPGSLWRIDPTGGTGYKRQLVSGPIYCANEAAAPAAADFPGLWIYDAGLGPNGCDRISDGTGYLVRSGSIIHRDTSRATALVCPAATFTAATPTTAAAGADTLLTSAGVHGLTTAACITAGDSYIYISGGTGWTVGFHKITAIAVDTTGVTVQIDTPFDAGFGTPTIVLANSGTDVVLETITLPRLSTNSRVTTRVTTHHPNTANNKNFKLKLGGTALYVPTYSNAAVALSNNLEYSFYNRGSVSSQVASAGNLSPTGLGSSSQPCNTSAIDTGTGTAQITLSYSPATANEVCGIEAYEVEVS